MFSLVDNTVLSTFANLIVDMEAKAIKINKQICKKCSNAIFNEKFHPFTFPLHTHRNRKSAFVAILTPLEERLVAPRIAFAQIRQLGYKRS